MGDQAATMIEWFLELNRQNHEGADPDRLDWRVWWDLIMDLPTSDYARLERWYEDI